MSAGDCCGQTGLRVLWCCFDQMRYISRFQWILKKMLHPRWWVKLKSALLVFMDTESCIYSIFLSDLAQLEVPRLSVFCGRCIMIVGILACMQCLILNLRDVMKSIHFKGDIKSYFWREQHKLWKPVHSPGKQAKSPKSSCLWQVSSLMMFRSS